MLLHFFFPNNENAYAGKLLYLDTHVANYRDESVNNLDQDKPFLKQHVEENSFKKIRLYYLQKI